MKTSNTANRLKMLMEERNLKQVDILELAKPFCKQYNIKLTKTDLSQYVSGKVEPGQFKLFVLSNALNVSEAWLMGLNVPMERNSIINVPHQEFDNEVLNAIKVLASCSGYDFDIFAQQYKISNENFSVKLSQNEVDDYTNSSIHQIQVVTERILNNKLRDNISSIEEDTPLENSPVELLNAAHAIPRATEEEKKHDDDIMDDENF